MADERHTLVNGRGERLRFVSLPDDPEHEPLVVHVEYRPGDPPPDHCHPSQRERFEVLDGALEVTIAGERRVEHAGGAFEIDPGVRHAMRAIGDAGATLRWTITPALRTEAFFRSMWALDAAGRGRTDLVRVAQVLQRHRREFRLARPAEPLQGALVGLLAWLGRRLGRTFPPQDR